MRKHTYITVKASPAAFNKRGLGALAPVQNAGIETGMFWNRPG